MDCINKKKHEKIVVEVVENMPNNEQIYNLSELFKIFGDNTRIKIMFSILNEELCVCDIAEAVNISQSATSHQLRVLKQSRLVKSRKEGKGVFYSLNDSHINTIFNVALSHIQEDK